MPTDPTTLPGWKWMPGMLAVTPDGIRIRLNAEREHVRCVEGSAVYRRGRMFLGPLPAGSQPDPTDPATAGCLLALLGPDVAVTVSARETGPLYRIGYGLDGRRHATIGHNSLGAACIAVAESLGRWPGGAS